MNLLTQFSEYLTSLDRSPATVRGYLTDLNVFARWLERDLTTLGPVDVREYRSALLKAGAKAQTVNRKLAAIAAFGNWAAQNKILPANPALNIKSVESVPLAPKWLDKKQRAAFVQAMKDDLQKAKLRYPRLWLLRLRDVVVVTLLLNTGLRVSEAASLRLADLLLTERKAALTVRAGKGSKQRSVPINAEARRLLDEWLTVRPEVGSEMLFSNQRTSRCKCAPSRSPSRVSPGWPGCRRLPRTPCATPSRNRCSITASRWRRSPRCSATKASTPPASTSPPASAISKKRWPG